MIWWIAWLLAFLSIAAACLALAIASLITSGKSQLVCVDCLLGASTVLVLIWATQGAVPKSTSNAAKKLMTVSKEHRLIQADYAASNLTVAQYMDDFVGPLRPVMAVDGYRSLKGSLPAAESSVQALIDKYPLDADLASRLVILKHAAGEEVHPVLAKFARAGGQASALLDSLASLYDRPTNMQPNPQSDKQTESQADKQADSPSEMHAHSPSDKQTESRAEVQTDQHTDRHMEKQAEGFRKSDVEIIETALPAGWYRRTALIDAYKKTGNVALKAVADEYKLKSNQWNTRALVIQMLTVSSLIPAIYVMFLLWSRRALVPPQFVPICEEFRRGYGTLLSVAYAQALALFFISVVYGVVIALSHGAQTMDNVNAYLITGSVLSCVVVATASFYFFICKPRGLSLAGGFLQGDQGLSGQNRAKFIASGYVCMVALSFCIRTILNQIPNFPQGMTNAGQAAMMQAMFSTNVVAVIFFAIAICIVAPLFEELLFRGLMYGWVRNRFGLLAGTIVSSLIFAAWHFDLVGFPQYFFMGVALAVTYERSRSLPVVVACHALWNITVLVVDCMLLVH